MELRIPDLDTADFAMGLGPGGAIPCPANPDRGSPCVTSRSWPTPWAYAAGVDQDGSVRWTRDGLLSKLVEADEFHEVVRLLFEMFDPEKVVIERRELSFGE